MKNRNKSTKFPVARIKKIMQKDEEVGKVAQATPVVISKALELFLAYIVNKTHDVTAERGSRKVEAYHLKHAVETNEMLDFLKELVEAIPDPSQGGTIDLEAEAESKRKRGKGKRAAAAAEKPVPSSSALSDGEAPAPAPKPRSRKPKQPAPPPDDDDEAPEPAPKKRRTRKAPAKSKAAKAEAEIIAAPPPSSSAISALPSLAGPSLSMTSTPALERDDPMDGTSRRAADEDMDDYDEDVGKGEASGSDGRHGSGREPVDSDDEDDWDGRR